MEHIRSRIPAEYEPLFEAGRQGKMSALNNREEDGMDPGEQTTGTRDEHYNLVSVLYHALHGAETCEIYALDAEAAGDERLVSFFREAQAEQSRLAEQAKELLGISDAVPGAATPDAAATGAEVLEDTGPVDVRGRVAPEVGMQAEVPPEEVRPPRATQQPPPGPPPDSNPPA